MSKVREKTATGSSASRRSKRVPLGVARTKLAVRATKLDGYVLRWINDEESRVLKAQEGGYEFVSSDEVNPNDIGDAEVVSNTDGGGSTIRKLVGEQTRGEPLYAYLMKIRKEWYEEDQAEKQARVDASEDAARDGNLAGFDNSYVRPNHSIK